MLSMTVKSIILHKRSNTEDEYKELLKEKGIDSSIKSHKFSALNELDSREFDIYFHLKRSGDFAYSTLERAVVRVLIEGNDVLKSALTPAFKTGMVDYVAGLDENSNIQDNNEDCRDFNKIIEKNLSPYEILKSKNSEAQAEQVVKYLKQECPEKIDELFKELTNKKDGKTIVKKFLSELENDADLNSKFLEWTNKQLDQFHQKLAEKFVPKIESVTTKDGIEIMVKYHKDSKVEDVKTSVVKTLEDFKNAFCNDVECNIPKKFNVFSFNSEDQYRQYLCDNGKKLGKFFASNNKNGEASIYLYSNKEGSEVDILKQWVIETIMKNNDLDHLPQQIREGMKDWTNKQLNQNIELEKGFISSIQTQEGESASMNQEQSIEGKQDFIDQVMSSSCITDLGIKPECKDKLQDLIKALQECNEKESIKPKEEVVDEPKEEVTDEPKEEITDKPGKSISDIFNNFKKALCHNQEYHGVQRVNISTIDGDEIKELTHLNNFDASDYDKIGYFIASNNNGVVDIKLYVNYEKDSSVLDLGSQTFVNPNCSYVPLDLNTDYEYGSYCAKAAQVMSFLIQRHPDHLSYFFEDLAKSGCTNGDRIMQELDNHYNSELQTWLVNQELI